MARRCLLEIGYSLQHSGLITSVRDVFYLEIEEIENILTGTHTTGDLKQIIQMRVELFQAAAAQSVPDRLRVCDGISSPMPANIPSRAYGSTTAFSSDLGSRLTGHGCAHGNVAAEVLVVSDIQAIGQDASQVAGKILVTKMTDPGWVFVMSLAAGLISEKGSLLSHTAIIGRELGIPTVVGVNGATEILKTGDFVELDGLTGIIQILPRPAMAFR